MVAQLSGGSGGGGDLRRRRRESCTEITRDQGEGRRRPLPLTHDCDQIIVIKLLNHRKREERERDVQVAISPSIFHQISTSTPPWMRNIKRKKKNSREMREREVSRQSILLKSHSDALERRRTSLYIWLLIVTVRSKRSTVTMKRSIVDRFD